MALLGGRARVTIGRTYRWQHDLVDEGEHGHVARASYRAPHLPFEQPQLDAKNLMEGVEGVRVGFVWLALPCAYCSSITKWTTGRNTTPRT